MKRSVPAFGRLRKRVHAVRAAPSSAMRSGGRVVEGARLESEYTPKAYPGFESLPLRHLSYPDQSTIVQKPPGMRRFSALLVRTVLNMFQPFRTGVWGQVWG